MDIKSEVIGAISTIFAASSNHEFDENELPDIEPDLRIVEEYFNVSRSQAIILSIIFSASCRGRTTDLGDVINYLQIESAKILLYTPDFDLLVQKGIITRSNSRPRNKRTALSDYFSVNPLVIKAVVESQPLPELCGRHCKTNLELLEIINEITDTDTWGEEENINVPQELTNILECNAELGLVKKFKVMDLELDNIYVYSNVIWKVLNGYTTINLTNIIEPYYQRRLDRVRYLQSVVKNNNTLIKLNLCKIEYGRFINEIEIIITEKSINLLAETDIKITSENKAGHEYAVVPQKIATKELFYNENERKQIELLAKVLDENGYRKTQKKLLDCGLPVGIPILLYGSPGTGKTETAYQIAKFNKREIIQVDIANSKSRWFGESEKKILQVFTDYRKYCQGIARTPILLLNEADAIISKRKDVNSSSVAQTENAVQNIILEQLENFSGILIATSNLISNLDSAFERRFLFKIKLENPAEPVRKKIWKSKLKNLLEEEYSELAKFQLSGGQIENVVRKYTMQSILQEDGDIDILLEFCSQETITFASSSRPIGFKV